MRSDPRQHGHREGIDGRRAVWSIAEQDFDSVDDRAVTIRERDSLEQVRVPIDAVVGELRDRLGS